MKELMAEQMLYLLYAKAYAESGTVTKGIVKSCLPKIWKENAEQIYQFLQQQGLIELTSRGRFLVTDSGIRVLVQNLITTNYKFDSTKGSKVLNALLKCIGVANQEQDRYDSSSEINFEDFKYKFKSLYFEERTRQELRGVVAIRRKEICQIFINQNPLFQNKLDPYFERLKSTGNIFSVFEKENEIIQWVE
jgi:hypothetical protein